MVRAALGNKQRIGQGPRRLAKIIPALSVVGASMLNLLPIVSLTGWYPDFGLLALLGWRLLRSDPWPAWWAAPLGLANDLIAGLPVGLSAFLWPACMLILDLLDRRTMWRDYWIEWLLATLLLMASSWVRWRVDVITGAQLEYNAAVPSLLLSIFVFPIAAWLVTMVDRWRLGR
ncbi:rod shape-determining protein MreD [Sphingomonas piscis]|uniref:Rod shape-determining protein MreD n=1 Tax=Sphingomonas piscis TaxID=2714943 RepID=A0A6G7YSE5_9SPHN|nr:rod shape-determining protein MreD [Sphingomonas piscis]QIK79668.1 rod shape-determining protein MreD [Sphingomonas piscis]